MRIVLSLDELKDWSARLGAGLEAGAVEQLAFKRGEKATVLKVKSSELRGARCPQGPQALGTREVSRLWTCGQRPFARFTGLSDMTHSKAYWF